ncbi:hypothetical protein QUF70_20355, partial [Desulfobacterales bacterium HSG17]|nr:hypothetical protein [Desulfobacterales bacterium HSG17]
MILFIQFIVSVVFVLLVGLCFIKWVQLVRGRKKADQANRSEAFEVLSDVGTVQKLTILPLIDYHARDESLKTEPGVSYLIQADDTKI